MAQNKVEYILSARDEASAVVANVLRQFAGIDNVLSKFAVFSSGAGRLGLGVGAIVATTSALVLTANAVADTVEQLERLESITGITTDRMQVVQQVIKDGGGDTDGFTQSLVRLNRALHDQDPLLAKIGVTSRDSFTALMQVARAITQSTDAAERDAIAMKLLGRAGADLIPDLENLLEKFDATYDSMSRAGGILGGDVINQARNLDTQMESLSRNWDSAMTRMKAATVPVASGIVSAFNDIWDAFAGLDKQPDVTSLQRRLTEAETRVRSLLAEANKHGGAAWNANALRQAVNLAEKLRQQLAELQGVDLELNRRRSLLEPPPGPPPARDEFADFRESVRLRGLSAPAERGEPGLEHARGRYGDSIEEQIKSADRSLQIMGKTLADIEVPALRLTEAGLRMYAVFTGLDVAASRMRGAVTSDIDATISQVIRGTDNIRVVFNDLTTSILADIAENAARFGIGLGLQLLGAVPGLGWLAPIGAGLAGIESAGDGAKSSAAARGGDTYYFSTMSMRDLDDQIRGVTGEWRRANARAIDVSRAGR